jgi:hypothetical protein
MDEQIKKEKIINLKDELKMLKQIIEPLSKKIKETESYIDFYERLKKVGDVINWIEHFGTHSREEDYYEAEILEIDLENRAYKVRVTKHSGDSVSYGRMSHEIGKIQTRHA